MREQWTPGTLFSPPRGARNQGNTIVNCGLIDFLLHVITSSKSKQVHVAAIGCNGQEILRVHLAAIGCNGLHNSTSVDARHLGVSLSEWWNTTWMGIVMFTLIHNSESVVVQCS